METMKPYHLGECQNGHKALLFMNEVPTDTDEKCYQCVCVECGEFYQLRTQDKNKVKNLILTPIDASEIFQSFEDIKQSYLSEVVKGKSIEEAVTKVNEDYKKQKVKTIAR